MMRLLRCVIWISLALGVARLDAAVYTGSVRAADQFVPGATVTASQGATKVTAFTDQNGRYSMELARGVWDVEVDMFEFTPARERITVGASPQINKDWTLEMPRLPGAGDGSSTAAQSGRAGRRFRGGGGRGPGTFAGGGRGRGAATGTTPATPQSPYQDATIRAAPQAPEALLDANPILNPTDSTADADDSFLVNGSTSGGLAASSDDETRRQRQFGGPNGGPPGAGFADGNGAAGLNAVGLPPGMSTNDSLGLGGFGTNAINGGFGVGPAAAGGPVDGGLGGGLGAGPSGGPGAGFGGAGGGGGRGGGGFSGGRGGGGGGRGGGGRGGQFARGPFNGQYASFGNRRRNRPTYTGSVSLTAQNPVLNAAPFSLNGIPSQKPYSSSNNFTASVGGPMVIPKIVNWQRASFNISYRGSLSRNGSNLLGSVPTMAEREGDFSGIGSVIYDPRTGQPFSGNMIPSDRIDPAAEGLLKYIPLPTYPGVVENYRLISTVPTDSQTIGVRLSAPIDSKDRTNFNVQYQDRDSKSRQLFGFTDNSSGYGISASAGWSHSFAPRFNNAANLTFSRNISKNTPYFAYTNNVAGVVGITGTEQDPINYGPPTLSFTNFSSLSDSAASLSRNQTMNLTDNITYVIRRKHNLTFGYVFRRLQQNSLNYADSRGAFTFSGLLTSELNSSGQPVAGTGFDFADFLLGYPQSSSLRFGSADNYFRSWATSWYAQDDMRLLAGLTLNVGIRYEYFAPYTELYGHLANLLVNPGFTSVSVVTPASSDGLPSSLVKPTTGAFSPRVGLAWRPLAKRTLLFRTGYSIFYSGSAYGSIASSMASQPPFAKTASIGTSLDDPLTIENGFATSPSQNVTNTFAVNPDYKLAYAQTWNFTVQNTLPHGLVIETEYIGTKGTNLAISEQPDRTVAGSSVAAQTLQIANATGFTYLTSGANSIFNAGQVRVTRRFTRGMSSTLLYTRSKSIDDASSFTGSGGTLVQYIDDLGLERGLSSFDQRNNLQATFVLSSPVGIHGMLRNGGWKTALLVGWTLNGNVSATSGTPLTAYVAGNLSNTGGLAAFGTSRAEATGLPVAGTNGAYFNTAAFTLPVAGQFGDAGRDTIPGLFQTSFNVSLNRAFRFGDSRRQLQLRISANNVLNHVVVTSSGTTVNAATYGLPTAASSPRTASLLLRYNF